jgi:UPF0271 protein
LDGVCRAAGTRVTYVKPHGALYNTVVHHGAHAEAVVGAVLAYGPELGILGLPNSELLRQATAAGIRCHAEAYADRAYNADGTLVSRRDPGALLDDPAVVAERVVRMVTQGRLTAVDGTELEIEPDSVCIHGDSPGAVAMARQVRAALAGAGVGIEAFT